MSTESLVLDTESLVHRIVGFAADLLRFAPSLAHHNNKALCLHREGSILNFTSRNDNHHCDVWPEMTTEL